jgi:aspartyl/glutamyl-tRNA(Asn/Gln) amidotransferase C subunit
MNQRQPDSPLTDQTVRHVANLARLALTDEEVATAKKDLTTIFNHIDHPTELMNHLREDVVGKTLSQEQVLSNAPSVEGAYFEVPKVLGDSE